MRRKNKKHSLNKYLKISSTEIVMQLSLDISLVLTKYWSIPWSFGTHLDFSILNKLIPNKRMVNSLAILYSYSLKFYRYLKTKYLTVCCIKRLLWFACRQSCFGFSILTPQNILPRNVCYRSSLELCILLTSVF